MPAPRSVVASLWSVSDQVTGELMVRFYRHRAAGLSKDEALRAAQTEPIREPVRITAANGEPMEMDASAPFFGPRFSFLGTRDEATGRADRARFRISGRPRG
jgi:CHAT domain-containing protein